MFLFAFAISVVIVVVTNKVHRASFDQFYPVCFPPLLSHKNERKSLVENVETTKILPLSPLKLCRGEFKRSRKSLKQNHVTSHLL